MKKTADSTEFRGSRRITASRIADDYLIWILIALAAVGMSFASRGFFSAQNLLSFTLGISVMGILVLACAVPLLLGHFDLSIESTLTLSALVGGMMVTSGSSPALSMAVVIAIGAAAGLINGIFISKLGMNPFIQTLSMNIILRGLVFAVSGGKPYTSFPEGYRFLGSGTLFGVPMPIVILCMLYAGFGLLLARTRWGRGLYASGQNKAAAFINGMSVGRITLQAFTISGVLAGLGGLVISTRMNAIDYNVGVGMSFEIFAAAVIGGIALSGGRGKLAGAFGGVVFLSLVSTILTWSNISIYWVETMRGFIILFAVLLDAVKNRIRNRTRNVRERAAA